MPQMKVTAFRSKPRIQCIDPNCPTNHEPDIVVGSARTCAAEGPRQAAHRVEEPAHAQAIHSLRELRGMRDGYRFRNTASSPLPRKPAPDCGAPMVIVTTARGPGSCARTSTARAKSAKLPRRPRRPRRKKAEKAAKPAAKKAPRQKRRPPKKTTTKRPLRRNNAFSRSRACRGMLETTAGYRSPRLTMRPLGGVSFLKKDKREHRRSQACPDTRETDATNGLESRRRAATGRMLLGPLRSSLLLFLNETQRGECIAKAKPSGSKPKHAPSRCPSARFPQVG